MSTHRPPTLAAIRSGGQSGVDRAALDAAQSCAIPICGWVPRGGWAEDYPRPPGVLSIYHDLRATASRDPAVRTRLNVYYSDVTVVVTPQAAIASPGTVLTEQSARIYCRPLLTATVADDPVLMAAQLAALGSNLVVNIAGPRESQAPGIYQQTRIWLTALFTDLAAK
ncbi:MAG: putative molybdenum carrier protein [Bowdeniella nasicola]|nr:putative molybdenum carrier protein [Bowdeniella nasicola]